MVRHTSLMSSKGRVAAMAGAVLLIFVICTLGCWIVAWFGLAQALVP